MKHLKRKICSVCGNIISRYKCAYCKTDHQYEYNNLLDYNWLPPTKKLFSESKYSSWIERMGLHYSIIRAEIMEQDKRIIDLGCGPNEFIRLVKREFPDKDAVGYDFIPKSKDVVKIDFEKEKLPFGANGIDLIFISHVLEHVDNFHSVMYEIFRVAKKIVIVLPNDLNIFRYIRAILGKSMGGNTGLPLVPVKDRHKWIYSVQQADNLMGYCAHLYNKKYKVIYFTHKRSNKLLVKLNKNLFANEIMYIYY